jgi:heme-degrading monooxygenase HmoA
MPAIEWSHPSRRDLASCPSGSWVDPAQPVLHGKTVIMRIWRTQVDEAHAEQYERFAAEESLPMFRAHQGFEGHLFGRRGGDCVVITIWMDDAAADALEASPHYRDTVARINAAGFLVGRSEVERFQLHGDVSAPGAASRPSP